MKSNSAQKHDQIAGLLSEIQGYVAKFTGDTVGILYLFFVPKFSIAEISEVHQLPPHNVNKIIRDFLERLLVESNNLRRFLARSSKESKLAAKLCDIRSDDLEDKINLLINSCETTDSMGYRIREIIGVAIKITCPAVASGFRTGAITKMDATASSEKDNLVKFSVELKEQDFFLGKQRIAADTEVEQVAKTCSDGTVLIERGAEKAEVGFHVALQKKKAAEYAVTFYNLPQWARPVSFSFAGPDDLGNVKEYELPSEFSEGKLYFIVENEERENVFLDRTEVYIGFVISETSEK